MISFIPLELTRNMLLFISIYFWVVVLLFWHSNISQYDRKSRVQPLLMFLVFIHLLFAFEGGDYFNYYEAVVSHNMDATENFYRILADFVGYNYLVFRIVVWGGAFLFFQLTSYRFKLSVVKSTFLLYVMFFSIFDYARASLGMAVYFFGLSYLCMPIKKKRLLSFLFGASIIVSSVIVHRSMAIAVLATGMIFIPISKKTLVAITLLFVMSAPLFNYLFNNFLMGNAFADQEINDIIASYAGHDFEGGFSVFEWVRRIVEYTTFFLTFILLSFKMFDKRLESDIRHQAMFKLYKVTLGLLMLAISTQMIGVQSFIIFYRYLYMSMIPLVLLFGYARERHLISHRAFRFIISLCLLNNLFGTSKRIFGGNLNA